MKFILSCLLISTAWLGALTGLDLDDIKSAEAHRQKTLQNLHIAQNPLHTKQEKATEVEISKYQEAVVQAVAFQQWIAHDGKRSLFLEGIGNHSVDTLNRKNLISSSGTSMMQKLKSHLPSLETISVLP
jgi:hypothetical protein